MKHSYEKFKELLININSLLVKNRIASMEGFSVPFYEDLRNLRYGEAEFNVLNPEVFEDIIRYANKRALQHSTQINAKIIETASKRKYSLIFSPTREAMEINSDLKKETENFLYHMLPAIKNYEKVFH